MPESDAPESVHLRIRREASGVFAWLREHPLGDWAREKWRTSQLFRIGGYLLAAFVALNLLLWVFVTRNLPSAESLLTYQPPLPTMVTSLSARRTRSEQTMGKDDGISAQRWRVVADGRADPRRDLAETDRLDLRPERQITFRSSNGALRVSRS